MTDPSDFDDIERRIADLQAKSIGCRKAMLLSRIAIGVAAVAFVGALTIAGSLRTPIVVFSAIAVMIGGTVWLGASKASLEEAEEALRALDAVRNRMIDKVAAENGWRDLTPTVH